jgi:hypothetical protein
MAKIKLGIAVALATAVSVAAYAAPRGGHGGAPQGGAHGGAPHVSAFHAAPHVGGTFHAAPHVGAFHGAPHFSGHAISHAHPTFRGNTGHTHFAHTHQPVFRGKLAHGNHGNRTVIAPNTKGNSITKGNRTNFATRNENRNATLRTDAVRHALNSHETTRALHDTRELRSAHSRALITARAATAGWHHGHNGWWRHRDGGYGWVGPLFWPFAYYDWYDYTLWGYDDAFWGYGYDDIYAGLFAPYGYDELEGYLPQPRANAQTNTAAPLAQMCGENNRDIAGLPLDQIRQAITPNDAQSAALQNLFNASSNAAQTIGAVCPTDVALTAPKRLAAMQRRVEAMIVAVKIVQPALDKFYGLLSDEQKARLTALGENERRNNTGSIAQSCGTPAVLTWPSTQIEQTIHPTGAQQTELTALQNAAAKAADLLKASCPSGQLLTPPARLAAVGDRLGVLLQAIKIVRAPLNSFYASLSDEQKANFDAIGPQRTAEIEAPYADPTQHLHRVDRVGALIHHFISRVR